ncbi:polyadenylate-binding protein RBP47C'-like isoform X2 [Oryza brachyantha]|uniref:polyadenylate-binding protein RBP47C'-like isoform X2 n=1 Tax=Oryza brachyantha TaxID=4533 RepID=UPI001ADD3FAC|nr:polyadenylate-binding protein RBP47C'-like isoform X2 [Oryza brachyantha]
MQMAAAGAAATEAPAGGAAPHHHHHHPHAHVAHGHPHHHIQPRWVVIPYPPPPGMVAGPPPPPPQFVKHFAPPASVTPPPPQPQAQPQQPPAGGGSGGNGAGDENRTIWVGDLQYWMDENYLHNCFGSGGEVVTIKVIRNRHSGVSEGYGFVEFCSHASAEKALQNFSGHLMPNTDRAFKINWASYSMGEKRSELASDYSIFVGDLAVDVTDEMLMTLFAKKYRSVKGAKVIIDANTGRSRGYGFVRFGDDNDKTHAMTEMNGEYCSSRPIRIGPATPRRSSGDSGSSPPRQSDNDSTNRTIYVGGLDPNVTEDELRKAFAKYGDLASVKIPVGKQCGFVQFVNRPDAEEALQGLNGSTIGKQAVRLSWGRSPASKQKGVSLLLKSGVNCSSFPCHTASPKNGWLRAT